MVFGEVPAARQEPTTTEIAFATLKKAEEMGNEDLAQKMRNVLAGERITAHEVGLPVMTSGRRLEDGELYPIFRGTDEQTSAFNELARLGNVAMPSAAHPDYVLQITGPNTGTWELKSQQ